MTPEKLNKAMEEENAKWPEKLMEIPEENWPKLKNIAGVLRSRYFLVQVYHEEHAIRLTVCRTTLDCLGGWLSDITWDELQDLKSQCGYADKAAVEIFPPEGHVVNVANMRHLWILDEPPVYMWNKDKK